MGPLASCAARAFQVSSKDSSGTASQINPELAASTAVILSAKRDAPIAFANPMVRGMTKVPPASGIRPIRVKACIRYAECAAITTSAAKARFAPAPAAAPFKAVIVGTGQSIIARSMGSYSSLSVRSMSIFEAFVRSPKSCPEQNARPVPVRTTTRASLPRDVAASAISARICVLRAFITSGRLSTIQATPFSSETDKVEYSIVAFLQAVLIVRTLTRASTQ